MWKDVGVQLGLEAYQLDAIEIDHSESLNDACFHMLLKWMELDKNVSRRELHQAIKYCEGIAFCIINTAELLLYG